MMAAGPFCVVRTAEPPQRLYKLVLPSQWEEMAFLLKVDVIKAHYKEPSGVPTKSHGAQGDHTMLEESEPLRRTCLKAQNYHLGNHLQKLV